MFVCASEDYFALCFVKFEHFSWFCIAALLLYPFRDILNLYLLWVTAKVLFNCHLMQHLEMNFVKLSKCWLLWKLIFCHHTKEVLVVQSQNHISYYGSSSFIQWLPCIVNMFSPWHNGLVFVLSFLQVRSKLTSLDNIVPPTHGFMISSTAMKNVWLSMEHQAILWCNQLVVQVSRFILVKSIYLVLLYVVLIIYILI